mmetsp:Transcript_2702/g.9150  ORF Transcript_2702/g.9150 Transcript_2702/m.9150 type:complete len:266 (+) Transcript_2702:2948-3745(+)
MYKVSPWGIDATRFHALSCACLRLSEPQPTFRHQRDKATTARLAMHRATTKGRMAARTVPPRTAAWIVAAAGASERQRNPYPSTPARLARRRAWRTARSRSAAVGARAACHQRGGGCGGAHRARAIAAVRPRRASWATPRSLSRVEKTGRTARRGPKALRTRMSSTALPVALTPMVAPRERSAGRQKEMTPPPARANRIVALRVPRTVCSVGADRVNQPAAQLHGAPQLEATFRSSQLDTGSNPKGPPLLSRSSDTLPWISASSG